MPAREVARSTNAWKQLVHEKSELQDNPLTLVKEWTGDSISVFCGSYRDWATTAIFENGIPATALAVSGVLETPDGFILGQRNEKQTQQEPSMWEFAPAGSVDWLPQFGRHRDVREQLCLEVTEELGLEDKDFSSMIPIALIYDEGAHVLDIGFHVNVHPVSANQVTCKLAFPNSEYTDVAVVLPREAQSYALTYASKELLSKILPRV